MVDEIDYLEESEYIKIVTKLYTELHSSCIEEIRTIEYINQQELAQKIVIITKKYSKKWEALCDKHKYLFLQKTGFLNIFKPDLQEIFKTAPLVISALKYL